MSRFHRRITSREWGALRRKVLDRDGWRCQTCGRAGLLECHHVKPLLEGGDNDLGNLLALCRDCHIRAHREIKPVNPWDLAIAELET